ncbi:hypothetical protein ALC56_10377 [Trachymyrmex septentrionalis]|uniref:Uncharacterized protein n=1 Tax=Trachymyrmex septentrionalis TaxID=34720 RepID=A0A195F4V5_9HYME|nr:hypothetical protein ALC56_10377 [Trachymyrmex septentrionalis]
MLFAKENLRTAVTALLAAYFNIYVAACNKTYYGDVGKTYDLELHRPKEDKVPYICKLTFNAPGDDFGDIVQGRAFSDDYVKLKNDRTPSFRERENFVECTKTLLPPAVELFAQQYLLAFSYLHSASDENPLYISVVCVQMCTGLVKEAATALKVTVMQNKMCGSQAELRLTIHLS